MHRPLVSAIFAVVFGSSSSALAADRVVVLTVKNMYCAACPAIVKGSLEAIPGVAKVSISYKDKTATVVFDDARTDVNQLTAATTNAGYPSIPKS